MKIRGPICYSTNRNVRKNAEVIRIKNAEEGGDWAFIGQEFMVSKFWSSVRDKLLDQPDFHLPSLTHQITGKTPPVI